MKKILFSLLLFPVLVFAQENSLTLQNAYDLAQQNFPLIKQRDLIRQTSGYTIENISKGFLPQLSFSGQATYQSAVTSVNIPIPGVSIEPLNKDQYRVFADVNQLIYDGGVIKQQKNIQQLNAAVDEQSVEVQLYTLKARINQLFLGVLYIDEQLKQVELTKADLQIGIKNVKALVDNGVAFRSNLSLLQAEMLQADQQTIQLLASRKGLLDVLGLFINQTLSENTQLERPQMEPVVAADEIQRPELKLYAVQDQLLASQHKLIDAKNLPKASAFFQGGYGRPGLNMLQNNFDLFYTTGVRFNWSFGGLYTKKKEKEIIGLNQKSLALQRDVFLLNTNTQLAQQQSEINKIQKLIDTDQGIIDLRKQVKEAAKAQLENGVITANDYLQEVNAENLARQNLVTHRVQLLQAQINYQTIKGKQ